MGDIEHLPMTSEIADKLTIAELRSEVSSLRHQLSCWERAAAALSAERWQLICLGGTAGGGGVAIITIGLRYFFS
jgi:hypothetical protein